MRIIHLSSYDQRGGAARAALRLHRALREAGEDSAMFVRCASSNEDGVIQAKPPAGLAGRLMRILRRRINILEQYPYRSSRPTNLDLFSGMRGESGRVTIDQVPAADVANLHWIADAFLDFPLLFGTLPKRMPMVWTLHDMNAFTGGCHYSNECMAYLNGCGKCPQLGSTDKNDLSRKIWQRKRIIFENLPVSRLHIVSPSSWLGKLAQDSPLLGKFPISVIPNSVDTGIYLPLDKSLAKEAMGLPTNSSVIFFAADSLTNSRKGFDLLIKSLQQLEHIPNLHLLSIGANAMPQDIKIPHRHLGRLEDDGLIALAYNAADVFAIPSIYDNFPNTVLEAMACGVPVVGFNAGGTPDMVRNSISGFTVSAGDTQEFGGAIERILADDRLRLFMSRSCRKIAETEFSQATQATCYQQLYQSFLSIQNSSRSA